MRDLISSPRRLRRALGLFLLGGSVALATSCASDTDESLASPSLSDEAATRPSAAIETAASRALDRAFPAHAARVLGRLDGRGFIAEGEGFAPRPAASLARRVEVKLPRDAGEAARFTAPGGFEVRVREIGAEGEASIVEGAVSHRRAGGSSFWTVTEGGVEEWLHLAAGTVSSDEEVAAAWEVEGAELVPMHGAVALMDEAGTARAWVIAPEAYGAGGRKVELRLTARGHRLELFADARGEELLVDPGWVAVAPCVTGRFGSTLTTLTSGKVLLAGGFTGATIPSAAEVYDPALNTWAPAGSLTTGRYLAASVLLGNGRALVLGGQSLFGYPTTTEQYNPATNTWSAAASMSTARGNASAVLLANGKVLAAGGYNGVSFLASAEIYDPALNTWAAAAPMVTARAFGAVVRLQNGKVLVAGGENGNINAPTFLASAELYDPVTNTWASAGSMAASRYGFPSALLADGRVVIAGGIGPGDVVLAGAELYDPLTNSWSATASMSTSRGAQGGVLLGNGKLLAAGGVTGTLADGMSLASAEIYDPLTNAWSAAGSLSSSRFLAGATALLGGDALVVAGTANGTTALTSVDRYYFSSLAAGAACGVAAQCASGFCVGGVCCQVAACSGDACHDPGVCQAGTGLCSTPNKPNGTVCNDGNACTGADSCQAGVCTGASPVVCAAQDQCHVVGLCNPATGACSNPAKPDGAMCNDGSACTTMDTCVAGACTGAMPVNCAPLDQCHDAGACNPATGACSNPQKPDGAACNDNNACLTMDTCVAGACTGAMPVVCAPLDQCHDVGACDPATGVCASPSKPDGAMCNDGSACTTMDTCVAGTCQGGTLTLCAPLDQCHDGGTCDPATGACSNPGKADGTACDDGDACTQKDACSAGACAGSDPVVCAAKDECHEVGTCASATGVCDDPSKPDGTPCTNGTCQGGVCKDSSTGSGGGGGSSTTGSGGAGGTSTTGGTGGTGGSTNSSTTGGTGGSTTSSTTGGTGGGDVTSGGGCGCRAAGSEGDDTTPAAMVALSLAGADRRATSARVALIARGRTRAMPSSKGARVFARQPSPRWISSRLWRLALRKSAFIRPMTSSGMPLGQAASHSPTLVQWPKPSAWAWATMAMARRGCSALPCGSIPRWVSLAPVKSEAEALGQAATQAPQPMQAAASIDISAAGLGTGMALASGALPVPTET